MATYRMDFENLFDAQKALAKLKDLGFKKSYLDMVGKYNEEYSEEININLPKNTPDFTAAMLQSGRCKATLEKAQLVATNPIVSGVGSLCELSGNRATSLFVKYEDEKSEEVKRILKDLK